MIRGGFNRTIGPDDLCPLGLNVPHSWFSEKHSGPVCSPVVQFRPHVRGKEFIQPPENRCLAKLRGGCGGGLSAGGSTRGTARSLLINLFDIPQGAPERLARLLEILGCISRRLNSGEVIPLSHPNCGNASPTTMEPFAAPWNGLLSNVVGGGLAGVGYCSATLALFTPGRRATNCGRANSDIAMVAINGKVLPVGANLLHGEH